MPPRLKAAALFVFIYAANAASLFVISSTNPFCPETSLAYVSSEEFCRSYLWQAFFAGLLETLAVAACLLAASRLGVPRVWGLLSSLPPVAYLVLFQSDLVARGLDPAGPEDAYSIFVGSRRHIFLANGIILAALALVYRISVKRPGPPRRDAGPPNS